MNGGQVAAVVAAAGRGDRVGASLPKQLLPLRGVPILVRAVGPFQDSPLIHEIVLVVPEGMQDRVRRLVRAHRLAKVAAIVPGGETRQESVRKGIAAVGAAHLVVHDGARPLVGAETIARVIEAAQRSGAATAGLPASETIKVARGGVVEATLQRDGLWIVQTPQAFRRDWLVEAHEQAARDGYLGTDDAALVERAGYPVRVVLGAPDNLKVTTAEDLALAEALLDHRSRRDGRR